MSWIGLVLILALLLLAVVDFVMRKFIDALLTIEFLGLLLFIHWLGGGL